MDYQQTFAISAAGMDIERRRLDIAAMNLANAQTVTGADGRGYRPQRVVVQSLQNTGSFDALLAMPAASVEATGAPDRKMLEPGHPQADVQGFVTYPGVDTATEMMTIMDAMRAYEANVAAMNASRTMAMKALEIGSGA